MIRIEPLKTIRQPGIWIDENGNAIGTTVSWQQNNLSIETSNGIKKVYFGIIDVDGQFYPMCEKSFDTCKTPCKQFTKNGCRLNPLIDFVGYYIEE